MAPEATEQASRARAPVSTELLVRITSPDGRDHLVQEGVFTSSPDGRFLARCGCVVISGSLTTEPGPICPLCAAPARRRALTLP